MPELLKDGETGLLFESGNSADLTAKLRSVWENERLVAGLKSNCARYAEASDTDGLRGYCEFLREVIWRD
jgi:glycosyltransferase involved in cell wall biosynthesis